MKDYQTVRWALAQMLSMGAARKQLTTTWTKGSGELPNPQSLDLQSCRHEALQLIGEFKQATDLITPEVFEEHLTFFQQYFDQSYFWEDKQYLIWFHGKDLKKCSEISLDIWLYLINFLR